MPRRFRLTCSRMTYFDVELTAEDAAEAERLLDAAVAAKAELCDGFRPVGKPVHHVVEIAALEASSSAGPQEVAA